MRRPTFDPHPLLRNRHAMTVVAAWWPRGAKRFLRAAERTELTVDADTRVELECSWQQDEAAPIALLMHGLHGSCRARYLVGTAMKAWERGFSVVRLTTRNCGGTEALARGFYHAGLGADADAVLHWLERLRPRASLYAAGFSLGGSLLLNAALDWQPEQLPNLRALAAVSTPLDLQASSDALSAGGFNRLYDRAFTKDFLRVVRRKSRAFPGVFDSSKVRDVRTLRDFDDRWTAPLFGFGDAENYYREASAARRLERLRRPTLVIHAADDPIVPLPGPVREAVREHPHCELLMVEGGGHNAFFGRRPASSEDWHDADRFWAENRVVQWFAEHEARRGGSA